MFIYDNIVSERQVKQMREYIKIESFTTKYRGMEIAYNLYEQNEYTVQYCGDDFFFKTEKEAELFIEDIIGE